MPHEPRLVNKLVDPLVNLINTTPAMSLLYEAISTAQLEHLPSHPHTAPTHMQWRTQTHTRICAHKRTHPFSLESMEMISKTY